MQTRRRLLRNSLALTLAAPLGHAQAEAALVPMSLQTYPKRPDISPPQMEGGVHVDPSPSPVLGRTSVPQGLAWEAARGKQRFLLVATLHSLAPQDHPLPKVIDACYAQSAGMFLEFTPFEQSLPAARKLVESKGYLPRGQSLLKHIPAETAQSLTDFLRPRPELSSLLKCKPWLATMWIQEALAKECGMESIHGVESYLCRRGGTDRKPIRLLESQSDALDALDNLSDDVQVEILKATLQLTGQGQYKTVVTRLRTAWKAGDEKGLDRLFEITTKDALSFRRAIIEVRNKAWVNRIDKLALKGTWMIAAGTQHFCGEKSIVSLLRANGYEVQQIIS